ncbi:MAG: hypothetical protein QOD45_1047 [Pseudonocardiales bacterium]|nr:hypothetical protein [Pseudonocardiales bacterium]
MTAAASPTAIRVRPAPPREPPFDDEVGARHLHVVGPLDRPLPFQAPPPHWDRPAAPVHVSARLPDPRRWTRHLLTGIFETAAGRRPLQQLAAMLSPSVAYGLGADFEKAAQARRRHWSHAARVRSVRATQPADGVAEICATIQVGDRVRAVALRVEEHRGRWRCTRLQLG